MQYGIRQSAEVENLMTSVERILEYGDLGSEADLDSDIVIMDKSGSNATDSGVVEFDRVCLSYGGESTKMVLKEVSFKTEAMEKIGIVGR